MSTESIGIVKAIAIKTAEGGPMREVAEATAIENATLDGSAPSSVERGVTFISLPQWREVQRELSGQMPWHTRRANVLIDADRLGPLIGATIQVGEARFEISGETRPCGLMDKAQSGLRKALATDCRGGVFGRVTRGGAIRVGDTVVVIAKTNEPTSG